MAKIHRFNNQYRWYESKAIKYSNINHDNKHVNDECLSTMESTISKKAVMLLNLFNENVSIIKSDSSFEKKTEQFPLLNAGILIKQHNPINEKQNRSGGMKFINAYEKDDNDVFEKNSYQSYRSNWSSSDCYSEKSSIHESHFTYK
ncbi:hypothetical protein C6P40_001608 [Pichia californica]|uniref:Uncharacterized protein n=1 Tax=Pichia californica TaxID=460514 RepID=A0A9P7BFS0_9ASCO|nr:hypothetical protein C6P42_001587 [[Candida] californica]KAG0687934.1 hypothetical protein C6P40_001608 [[Candida] californica]